LEKAEGDQLFLSSIVSSAEDGIISKGLDGIITSWNKAAERIFGYTAEEMIGKPVTLLIPADHPNEEPQILARIRRGERIEHYETKRRRKDGSRIDVALTVSPIRDGLGRIIGASKIARDITEQKQGVIRERHPDLLVSDIGMPGLDGYEFIRIVREDRQSRIPAVALTALARIDDRVKALSSGYQMHVSKPVEPSELVSIVASLAGLINRDPAV
jgi:PAS domain S-box-containing protein